MSQAIAQHGAQLSTAHFVNVNDFAKAAKEYLPKGVYDYYRCVLSITFLLSR